MHKMVAPLAVTAAMLVACAPGTVSTETGQGTVTEIDYDAPEYYSHAQCLKKFSKARCIVPQQKSPEDWDITIIDTGSHEAREIEVTQAVFNTCQVGEFFDGAKCP